MRLWSGHLGGPGQEWCERKPTFDPSPLMRLPGSTRRSCAVQARSRPHKDGRSVTVQHECSTT